MGLESRFVPTAPAFDAPARGIPSEYCRDIWYKKLEWLGYPKLKKQFEVSFIRFDRMYERDRQTDRRTDTHTDTA